MSSLVNITRNSLRDSQEQYLDVWHRVQGRMLVGFVIILDDDIRWFSQINDPRSVVSLMLSSSGVHLFDRYLRMMTCYSGRVQEMLLQRSVWMCTCGREQCSPSMFRCTKVRTTQAPNVVRRHVKYGIY